MDAWIALSDERLDRCQWHDLASNDLSLMFVRLLYSYLRLLVRALAGR